MSNRQKVEHALECFGTPAKRNIYFELYSEDVVLHGYEGIGPGLREVKQFYTLFWDVFPDAQVKPQDIIEQGDTVVIRYVITGTQQKPFMGISPAGRPIELPGISIFHFRNGQCVERWTCSDSLLLLKQIRG
jgi:predicted ester cyclase